MTFSSLTFLVFFVVVFASYWMVAGRRLQNGLLLLTSYVFYGWWDWRFAGLMLISSLVDFVLGLCIHRSTNPAGRRWFLLAAISSNLLLLGFFKYFNFFVESFSALAASLGWSVGDLTLQIVLPVGISFYTFQTLSYSIDIYRKELAPTSNLVDYLAFVSFFPQLVAGPIERASQLLPQFGRDRQFDYHLASDGLRQFLWGLFKKLAVADRLALIVEPAFANPKDYTGPFLTLATVCFAFQIYCDFSGYSDMAVGTAKQLGIRLSRNFAYPYFSRSLREFWRRWHISLSSWFRDYVYYPLGGNRTKRKRNLLLTFLVSGIWHGAAWTFVAWGGLHGILISFLPAGRESKEEPPGGRGWLPSPVNLLKMLFTFAVVCHLWVFFRAESVGNAILIWQRMAVDWLDADKLKSALVACSSIEGGQTSLMVLLIFIGLEWAGRSQEHPIKFEYLPVSVRWAIYTALFWGTVLLIPSQAARKFIYFDF